MTGIEERADLQRQAASLAEEVRRQKCAIRTHREQLATAAAALEAIEAKCRTLGIGFSHVTADRTRRP